MPNKKIKDILPVKAPDVSVFDHLMKTILYSDQVPFVEKMIEQQIGQGIDPTGMGKSMIANSLCAIVLDRKAAPGIVSFASPTKVLGAQLLIETMIVMAACGIKKVAYMTVNSDIQPVLNRKTRKWLTSKLGMELVINRNSMVPSVINEFIERNKEKGYHTVFSSTYHSMNRILKACQLGEHRLDCHINDEPQKLVNEQFAMLSEPLPDGLSIDSTEIDMDKVSTSIQMYADRMYSFTATPKHTFASDGIGMQNEERFGPVLHSMTERECYELGRKVPPKLIRLDGLEYQIDSPKSMGFFVMRSYEAFAKRWKVAKVLYDTKGRGQMKWFIDSGKKEDLMEQGVNIAHCDSANGYWINDEEFNDTSAWLAALQQLDEDMPLICLHVEMIVEGLDVPGFNCLMMMKTRSQSKLKQLIGRIQRLLGNDRDMMGYGADFTPMNLLDQKVATTFLKPYAEVAYHQADNDIGAYAKQIMTIMRDEYGFSAEELADFTDYEGTSDRDPDESGREGGEAGDKKYKDIVDVGVFTASLTDIDSLYNNGEIDFMTKMKARARKALNLT